MARKYRTRSKASYEASARKAARTRKKNAKAKTKAKPKSGAKRSRAAAKAAKGKSKGGKKSQHVKAGNASWRAKIRKHGSVAAAKAALARQLKRGKKAAAK
jgi:hypothetical protein